MPIDLMIEKAKKLLRDGRVEQIGNGTWNIIGNHGTYTVVMDYTGKVSCNCPGFRSKGRCSHSAAVVIQTKLPRQSV